VVEIYLNYFAVVVNTGFQLKKELQSRLNIFANFLVGALKLQLINVKSLSEWQLTIEINQRSQPSFGSFEDGFDRLIGIFGIQRNVKESAYGFD